MSVAFERGGWSQLLRLLVAEATSGITVVSGITGVVAMVLMTYLSDSTVFDPGGGNTLNVPLSLCFLLAPLLGGLAATRVGRLEAQGALDLAATTRRGRVAMLTVVATAYLSWAVVAYACGVAMAGAVIGVTGPWTPGMALLPVLAAALLLAFIVLGVCVGAMFRSIFVGPVLTIIGLVALNALDTSPDPVGRFSPLFAGISYSYGRQPNSDRVTGLVLVLLAVAALLFAARFYARALTRVVVAVVGVLLLAGGSVRVLAASPDALESRTGGPGDCRSSGTIRLCVWPGPGVQVDNALMGLLKVRSVASRLGIRAPTHYHEEGLRDARDSVVIMVAPPSPQPSYGVSAAVEAMLPQPCDTATERQRLEMIGLFRELLSPGNTSRDKPYSTGVSQAHRPLADQRVWAARRIAALRACH